MDRPKWEQNQSTWIDGGHAHVVYLLQVGFTSFLASEASFL